MGKGFNKFLDFMTLLFVAAIFFIGLVYALLKEDAMRNEEWLAQTDPAEIWTVVENSQRMRRGTQTVIRNEKRGRRTIFSPDDEREFEIGDKVQNYKRNFLRKVE